MVLVALNDHVQLGVVGQAGQRQVGRTDNGDALLVPVDLLADQIEHLAVVADVRLRVESALRVDAHLQPLLLDHPDQPGNQLLRLVRLVHQLDRVPEIPGRLFGHLPGFGALRVDLPLDFLRRQVQPPVALGQHFDGFAVGRVADQQPEFLQVQKPLRDARQAGQEKIADRKPGPFARAEHLVEMVNQLLGSIVYDVMGGHGLCVFRNGDRLSLAPGDFNDCAGFILAPLPLSTGDRFDAIICPRRNTPKKVNICAIPQVIEPGRNNQ